MFYPILINLKNKKVLIVGGGNVGSRRALYMLKAGAVVTVVSKEFNKELLKIKNKNLRLIKKEIKGVNNLKINFGNYFLIIVATINKKINQLVTNKINKNKILTNRADDYKKGNVIFPAVASIGKNKIAFTTFGKDPKLSKYVKGILEKNYGRKNKNNKKIVRFHRT